MIAGVAGLSTGGRNPYQTHASGNANKESPGYQTYLGRWYFAQRHRLLGMYPDPEYVCSGGLMSYARNVLAMRRRAAAYVDKILKAVKPADLAVEQPATFELVLNLKTVQALGLTIPPTLLFQADEVIR